MVGTLSMASAQAISDRTLASFDHYFFPKPTELVLTLESGSDSLQLSASCYQMLEGRFHATEHLAADHWLIHHSFTIALEKPTLVQLVLADWQDEILLLPGVDCDVRYLRRDTGWQATFADETLAKINAYYDAKTKLVGFNDIRQYYNYEIRLGTLEDLYSRFDSLKASLIALVEHHQSDLPGWWKTYELQDIYHADMTYRSGARHARAYLFGYQDTLVEQIAETSARALEDFEETEMLSAFSLPQVEQILRTGIRIEELRAMGRVEYMSTKLSWHEKIPSGKIHDVYVGQLYRHMLNSSSSYPDSLYQSMLEAVGPQCKAYLEKKRRSYLDLNGKKAPNFYLKDRHDVMRDLGEHRGKVVLLDFWFIGCRACTKEWPHDRALVQGLPQDAFAMIKICVQSDPERWKALLDKESLAGLNLISNEGWDAKLRDRYQLRGFPRYVLVDQEGIIVDGWCERPSDAALLPKILQLLSKEP